VNGLSLNHRLTPILGFQARADRVDSSTAGDHTGQLGAFATLVADPLPTLGASLGFSTRYAEVPTGSTTSSAVTGLVRALLYEGFDVASTATYSFGDTPQGETRSTNLSLTSSITPNERLILGTGYVFTRSTAGGVTTQLQQLSASAASNPLGSVTLSGSVTRTIVDPTPQTGATVSVGWAPFQGGTLQLGFGYTRTIETATSGVSQFASAGARWNIRPRTYFDTTYSYSDATSTVGGFDTRAISARLVIGI
jgi:hypothetical protein